MALTKQELIAKVAADADVSQAQAKSVVDATFEAITGELKSGGEVAVSGFGKFSVSKRAAREGRKPGHRRDDQDRRQQRREVLGRCRAQEGAQLAPTASRAPRLESGRW